MDNSTQDIHLKTVFNPKAPNVNNDKNDFSWEPSEDEINFLHKAFTMFETRKFEKTVDDRINERSRSSKQEYVQSPDENTIETASNDETQLNDPEEEQEIFETPVSQADSKEPIDEETDFEEIPQKEDNVLVSADAKTIDEIVKRKRGESDESIKQVTDDTILEKILKQKKKDEI